MKTAPVLTALRCRVRHGARVPRRARGHGAARRLHGLVAAERTLPSARRGADHLDGDGRELRGGSRLPVRRRRSDRGQGPQGVGA